MKPIIFSLLIIPILVGMQLAYATNESDYKWGFKSGEAIYQQCSRYDTCMVSENLMSPTDCALPYHGPHWYRPVHTHMLIQIGPSICKYQDGGPVIAARTGPGHCYNTTKEGETCESGNFIPIH
jgi:hypothetical protein